MKRVNSARCLWKNLNPSHSDKEAKSQTLATHGSILKDFSTTPPLPKSLSTLCGCTLVVGQEFALTCLFLARHRAVLWEEEYRIMLFGPERIQKEQWLQRQVNWSQGLALLALLIIAIYANSSASPPQPQPRKAKVQQRTSDAILWAILLRMLASVLRTLTASFSTDTVERLTIAGMVLHWFTCDYSYANGVGTQTTVSPSTYKSRRPPFQGGTVSLDAAFFSTTLLASRLTSNATVYIFVSSAIILFAFFPAARHSISQHPRRAMVHSVVTLLLSVSTCCLLNDMRECLCFSVVLLTICGVAPLWKCWLQGYKRKISGPWDVVSVGEMKLDY